MYGTAIDARPSLDRMQIVTDTFSLRIVRLFLGFKTSSVRQFSMLGL